MRVMFRGGAFANQRGSSVMLKKEALTDFPPPPLHVHPPIPPGPPPPLSPPRASRLAGQRRFQAHHGLAAELAAHWVQKPISRLVIFRRQAERYLRKRPRGLEGRWATFFTKLCLSATFCRSNIYYHFWMHTCYTVRAWNQQRVKLTRYSIAFFSFFYSFLIL